MPVLTDIHEPAQAAAAPRRSPTCCRFRRSCRRQTDLLVAAARTGRAVNIKKGQFLAPARHAARDRQGHRRRATRACSSPSAGSRFGYNNLVVDMRAFPMHARARLCRSSSTSRTACSCPAAGDGVTAGSGRVHRAARVRRRRGRRGRRVPRGARRPGAAKSDAQNALALERLEPLLAPAACDRRGRPIAASTAVTRP